MTLRVDREGFGSGFLLLAITRYRFLLKEHAAEGGDQVPRPYTSGEMNKRPKLGSRRAATNGSDQLKCQSESGQGVP